MTVHITDEMMTLETGNRVVATARFSEHAAANGNGAWIVSTYPRPGDHGADRRRTWGERYLTATH